MHQATLGIGMEAREARSSFPMETFRILPLEDDMEGTRIASSRITCPSESVHGQMEVTGPSEYVTSAATLC